MRSGVGLGLRVEVRGQCVTGAGSSSDTEFRG